MRHTGSAADAERLAREADAVFDTIVAAGGDGTINAVANGIAGTDRVLAVLPFGTANVLACEIGLPRDPDSLARLIAVGAARPIWPGVVNGRLFVMMAGTGFDAAVVAAVRPKLKRIVGRVAFASAVVDRWFGHRWNGLLICVAGVDYPVATVVAANGRHYGGPLVIAPQAALAEPALDFVLFRRPGRLAVLCYLTALYRGRLARRGDILVIRAREALVTAGDPAPVQADGEIVGELPARIAVAERPLFLVTP